MKSYITKADLENTKNQIKEKRNFTYVLKGDIPVLFTARQIMTDAQTQEKFMNILVHNPDDELAKKALNYSLYEDYVLAILYLLHKKLGCSVLFTTFNSSKDYQNWLTDLTPTLEFYQNPELISFIKKKEIQTLINVIIREYPLLPNHIPPRLLTTEYHSSYNYLGVTNFTKSLLDIARDYHMKTMGTYEPQPNIQTIYNTNSYFCDEVIEAYKKHKIKIGELQNRQLTPKELWPYTMEAKFTIENTDCLNQIITIFNILYEHTLYTQEQISQKGLHRALSLKN